MKNDVPGRLESLGERPRLGQRLLGLAELGEEVVLMPAIASAHSVMPRRSQKSIPSGRLSSAACGPSYSQTTSARLLCSTAASRP